MEKFDSQYDICPHCGYAAGTMAEEAIHIQPGTCLRNRYIVGKVLGFGGFGVTYIAWDERLQQRVAIKEYLPTEFSTRMPGQMQVTVFGGEKSQQFQAGLSKFVDEAKRLAKFKNEPGIVKIFDSFEENSTAYLVMEYLQGETLASYLERMGTISEQNAVAMLMPVMESLEAVHAEGLIHRDIAPDNIFLTNSGEIKLIDFGASRYATTSHSRSLTVVIKQGFSPEEQYRSRGDHGPHTDVYALSATLYKMITGKTPPDAMERRVKYETKSRDILVEPSRLVKKISKNRENAILNALNVRIEDRTPTVADFMRELEADPPAKRIYGKIKLIDRLRWPLWLKITLPVLFSGVLVFALLLFTGVINFSKFSQEMIVPDGVVSVPDVYGLYNDEAVRLITEAKLLAVTDGTVETEYIPAGKIVKQTPVGGHHMNINDTVLLMVSSGKGVISPENGIATVPYVVWEMKETAIAKLLEAGLAEPDIEERHDESVALGAVISQSLEAGNQVAEGFQLTLVISLGPAAFEMPNVVGQTREQAEKTLTDKGLVVSIEYKKDDTVAEDTVISQNTPGGSSVKRGDQIVITVSSGRETVNVANVVGKAKDEAQKTLKDQGFRVSVLENYDEKIPAGQVIHQSPEAGSAQLPDSIVVIYVSKGKRPITISYNPNGGTVTPESKTGYRTEPYGDLPIPSRAGYTFDGWYSSKAGGTKVTAQTVIEIPSSHSLYAHWSPKVYTVSFNANGGSVTPSPKKVTYGEAYGRLEQISRAGYTFVGWYTAASGGTEVLADSLYTVAADQTLYARWTNKGCTVTFDANGGSVSVSSKNVAYDSAYGTLPTAERTGYVFQGWYTAKTGGNKITETTTVSVTGSQTLYARWTAGTYTVIFSANGGSVTPENKKVTFDAAYGDLPTPTRVGYTFKGWKLPNGDMAIATAKVQTAADHTLVATWGSNPYTVSFNANGGSVSPASKTVTYNGYYSTLPEPTRTGYAFVGWYTAVSGGTEVIASTRYTVAADQTLYARWGEKAYPVTFNANGGTVDPTTKNVVYDATYGSLPTPTRTGYAFKGWYTSATGGSEVVSSTKVTMTTGQTVYAHWQANKYSVTLDPNGGHVSTTKWDVTFDSAYGAIPTPTRDGYRFNGWKNKDGQTVTATTKVSTIGNHTLVADWTANTYTVKFNANGGSVSTSSQNVRYGGPYGTLPTPTRKGYSFNGWYSAPSGGTKVTSDTTVSVNVDHSLYAQWTANTYTVTFTGAEVSPMTVTYGEPYGTLPTPTQTGYEFLGWFTSAEGISKVSPEDYPPAEDHALYGKWRQGEYTVIFYANGGSVSPTTQTALYGSSYGTLPTPTRTGYTFSGWYTSASGGTKVTAETNVLVAGNHTLYAQWAADEYTVTFKTYGGSVSPASISVVFGSTYGDLPTPTLTGQSFLGWYTSPTSGELVTSETIVSKTGDHFLWAHWTINSYTVTFNANGGSVSPASISIVYGSTYGDLPTPTRQGYKFDGWFTSTEGISKVSSADRIPAEDHVLYAKWTYDPYTVTFNANGGSVSPTSQDALYGGPYGPLPTPTRTGYTFNGWYTSASGGTKVTAETNVLVAGNHTLYAQWTAKTLTITFDANGGSVSPTTKTVKYGELYGTLPTPTRPGYTFAGWYSTPSGGIKINASDTVKLSYETVTVYANWYTTLSSISVATKPTKTSYYVGQTLDPTGLTLTATYSNGEKRTITKDFTCTPETLSSAGTQTITVTYGYQSKKTTTFTVTVKEVALVSLSVKSMPYKTVYSVGEVLNTAGLSLTATYNNGVQMTITSGFSCSPTTMSSIGVKTITVSYGSKSTQFRVTVTDSLLA